MAVIDARKNEPSGFLTVEEICTGT